MRDSMGEIKPLAERGDFVEKAKPKVVARADRHGYVPSFEAQQREFKSLSAWKQKQRALWRETMETYERLTPERRRQLGCDTGPNRHMKGEEG